MYARPDMHCPHVPSTAGSGAHARRRLVLGLCASAVLHLLWLGFVHAPAFAPLPPRAAAPAPLRLTLAAPAARRVAPAAVPPSEHVRHGAAPAPAAPRRPQPAAAPARAQPLPADRAQRDRHAPTRRPPAPGVAAPAGAAPQPLPDAGPAPRAPDTPDAPAGAPQPSGAAILAAARHDAAAIARDLNHAPGSKTEFRSRAQEELDRRFDAAHAAGGSWFRSARVEEITTAADGSRRVYRIVTPLGTFCRTYYGDGSRPMNTTCPR